MKNLTKAGVITGVIAGIGGAIAVIAGAISKAKDDEIIQDADTGFTPSMPDINEVTEENVFEEVTEAEPTEEEA